MKFLVTILFVSIALVSIAQKPKVMAKQPVKPKQILVKTEVVSTIPAPQFQSAVTKRVKIYTTMGDIVIGLYDSTPKHRDNFLALVNEKFYDSLLFHRIIQGFMIQGGDPLSRFAAPGEMLGNGGGDRPRIPAEIRQDLVHKKGSLCAARDTNSEKASSHCQFYIVHGQVYPKEVTPQFAARMGFNYTQKQLNYYSTVGGTPMLDNNYTVYGEVESGLEILDRISGVNKDPNDRPLEDVRIITVQPLPDYVAPIVKPKPVKTVVKPTGIKPAAPTKVIKKLPAKKL